MTNKIVAIQGNHPSKLKLLTDTSIFLSRYIIFFILNKSNDNEAKFLNHLDKLIDNKTTNADHMINKFSKNENLKDLYDQ